MYAGDMGGRIWRFDIFNGKDPSSTTDPLVTGGVLATLGAGDTVSDPKEDNRRFYNTPDVSLIQIRGTEPFFNIAIGSGYRGHPLDDLTSERFYSVRDPNPYTPRTQDDYNKATPILDGDLENITEDPLGTEVLSTSKGWVLEMTHGKGEKVLSESTTVNGVILFTSFEPTSLAGAGDCFPTATNRAYALTAFGGKPAINFYDTDENTELTNEDISTVLKEKNSIVGDVAVAVLRDDDSSISPPTVCLAGMEVLKKCVNVGGTIRTFWNRGDAK
jgi:type IV pilus assembly protein PilY1